MGAAAPRRSKRDAKAALAAARLPERSVELCLRGDLVAEWQELERQMIDAEKKEKTHGSLDGGPTREVAERLAELQQEMLEHTITLKMRALPRREFAKLIAANPPREGNQGDQLVGYNVESLLEAAVPLCTFEPTLDEDDWARLDEVLSDGQWQALMLAAQAINIRDFDVPFSRRASRLLASSAPDSEPPEPGE